MAFPLNTPEYIDYHKIIDFMEAVQQASPRLQTFGEGDIIYFSETLSGGTAVYPYMFVTPLNISYDENITTYELSVIFADIVNTDMTNQVDCISDMSLEARNLLSQIWRGSLFDYCDVQLPATAIPFSERFNDHVAGVSLDMTIIVREDMNACPMYELPAPTASPACDVTPTMTPSNTATPTITPTNTATPTITPTNTATPTLTQTPTNTCPITTQYLKVNLGGCSNFSLSLWEDSGFTNPTNALCDYSISGTAYGDQGTIYNGAEIIQTNDHTHTFNLNPVLQPGECVTAFTVNAYATIGCVCPVNLILPLPPPSPTPTTTSTPTNTPTLTQTPTASPIITKITPAVVSTNGNGNLDMTGIPFNIIFNGTSYPMSVYSGGTGLPIEENVCIPVPYPSSGNTYTFEVDYPTNWVAPQSAPKAKTIYNNGAYLGVFFNQNRWAATIQTYDINNSLLSSGSTFIQVPLTANTQNGCLQEVSFGGSGTFFTVVSAMTFTITSGQSQYEACNSGLTGTIYARNDSSCSGCAPLNCWACLSTSRQLFLDPGLTIPVPNAYYTNDMSGSGNYGTWFVIDGFPQGAGFIGGCSSTPPSPPSGSHAYSFTGYSANTTYSTACDANPASGGTLCVLYGDNADLDLNAYFYNVSSGTSTTNLFGQYYFPSPQPGPAVDYCFNLDSYGKLQGYGFTCSSIC